MRKPIDRQALDQHESNYKQVHVAQVRSIKRNREDSIKQARDHVAALPYQPNLSADPNDELSR